MVTLAFKIICAVHIHFSMSKIMCTKNSTICNKLASKCTPLNNNDFVVYSRICVFVVVVVFINDLIIYINFVYMAMLIIIRGAVYFFSTAIDGKASLKSYDWGPS